MQQYKCHDPLGLERRHGLLLSLRSRKKKKKFNNQTVGGVGRGLIISMPEKVDFCLLLLRENKKKVDRKIF